MPGLEEDHPAAFLTLMHDSNSRQVMTSSEDVDLFQAVHNETTSWVISNLTRNKELANATQDALSWTHIAKAFQAGGWKKLTAGWVYRVAAGLVREMTAQVDLLTKGMSEVPKGVVTLMPCLCQVSALEVQSGGRKKKKQPHPWDALPGKLAAALEQVKAWPASFVTPLNPKTADPWTLPDVLLKVCAKEEHLECYAISNPDPLESEVDHPAGVLANVLRHSQGDSPQIVGYERKAKAQRPRLKRQKELGGSHGVGRSKRARFISAPETLEDGQRESEDEDDGANGSEAAGGDVDMEEEGSEGVPEVLVHGGRGSEMDEDDYTPWLGVGGQDESGEDGEDDGTDKGVTVDLGSKGGWTEGVDGGRFGQEGIKGTVQDNASEYESGEDDTERDGSPGEKSEGGADGEDGTEGMQDEESRDGAEVVEGTEGLGEMDE
ncbi:hypothetical protein FRC06_001202 [Ceratobasidium sp. 370]|nr:hypothetical protein FRC06_001202 [Ceratobasidium sp. 370]